MASGTLIMLPTRVAFQRGWQRFFGWWRGELGALVPARIRFWWRGTARFVVMRLDGTRVVFSRPAQTGFEEVLSADISDDGSLSLASGVQQRLSKAAGRGYLLLLALPEHSVLQKTLRLPAAVAENLRQTLGFELDRYTPFRPEQAYFDYRVADHAAGGHLLVELAVAPRQAVDQLLARTARLGLSVGGVVPAEDIKTSGHNYRNLLPAVSGPRRHPARLRQRIAYAAIAAALLAVFLVFPIWQKRAATIALLPTVDQAKAAAQEADALRDKLGKLVEAHDYLPGKKWDSPSTVKIVEELTKLLPDDTFLMQLDFDGKTIQILGETASSATMVESIEASPLFKDVTFRSPLTKIQGTSVDRFQIGAALEPTGRPEAKPAGTESPGPAHQPAAGGPAAPSGTAKAAGQ